MTLQDAARTYGYADATLRQAIIRGDLTGEKVGPVWTLRLADLDAYMAERKASGKGRPRGPGKPRKEPQP